MDTTNPKPEGQATLYRANGEKVSLYGWPQEFAQRDRSSVVGQLRSIAVDVQRVVAEPLSGQNYKAAMARQHQQPAAIPEVAARRVNLAQYENALRAAREKAAGHLADISVEHENLRARVTGKGSKPDYADVLADQEMRSYLRSLPTQQRLAAIKSDPLLKAAALRASTPSIAGLDQSTFNHYLESEVRTEFADRLVDLEDREAALTKLNENLSQIQVLVDEEKTAIAGPAPTPNYLTSFLKDTEAA
jgi:hypothetical protein